MKYSKYFFSDSILVFVQVVQEYERAVIFRLGRLRKGGAKVLASNYEDKYFILIISGPWHFLCNSLCWQLSLCWYENRVFWCSTSGGMIYTYTYQTIMSQLCSKLSPSSNLSSSYCSIKLFSNKRLDCNQPTLLHRSCRETRWLSRWMPWFTSTSSRRSWLSAAWTTTGECEGPTFNPELRSLLFSPL